MHNQIRLRLQAKQEAREAKQEARNAAKRRKLNNNTIAEPDPEQTDSSPPEESWTSSAPSKCERESLCVVSALLGATAAPTAGDAKRGPTTHTKPSDHADDFTRAFADYVALDTDLYAEAAALLDAHLAVFPQCRS